MRRSSRPAVSPAPFARARARRESSRERTMDVEGGMSSDFFTDVPARIGYGGPESSDPLAYTVYEPDRMVLGKRMEDHLRIAVCLWHSFNWPGADVFGVGTFDRPWLDPRLEPMIGARAKLEAAFEFIDKVGVPFFCFHDRDIAPERRTFAHSHANAEAMLGHAEHHLHHSE